MARPRVSDEHKKEIKSKRTEEWYDRATKDGYKAYLENTGKKQLKLTLTIEEDEALRAYCNENNLKPQEYIKSLIRQALGIGK